MPGNPTCGTKNRVWDFFAKTGLSCLGNPVVSATLASGKVACSYKKRVDPNCCGEQWDEDLGLYYNRARYLNVDSGRFWIMDSYEGRHADPSSLHKYLYANANPVKFRDPSGHGGDFSVAGLSMTTFVTGVTVAIVVPTVWYASQEVEWVYVFNTVRAAACNALNAMHAQKEEPDGEGKPAVETPASDNPAKDAKKATEKQLEKISEGGDVHKAKKDIIKESAKDPLYGKSMKGTTNPDIYIGKNGEIILRNVNNSNIYYDTGLNINNF